MRVRFSALSSLLQGVYHSLVRYLEDNGYIQVGPFDAQLHKRAVINDIDPEKVAQFIRLAKARRGFPLEHSAPVASVLHHLHLLEGEKLTHAALLLFGNDPQRYFPSATVKCAVFHGYAKTKPIPSYKILGGDLFEQIHQATEFVMSQLDFRVGTRAHSEIAPGSYELPREVVAEAVVNAIVHRNYADKGSVEVILYKNRLEISNPGSLPLGWTTDRLKQLHNSVPHNPLIAHPMYLAGYIEQLGTEIQDMIHRLKAHGLPEPEFAQQEEFSVTIHRVNPQDTMQDTMQVSPTLKNLVRVMNGEHSREELQEKLQMQNRDYFRKAYINEALEGGWIEQTLPDKPTSKNQKYRLTAKGNLLKEQLDK